jgi:hypothetical protein
MAHLLDTNVLVRLANTADALHAVCHAHAVTHLLTFNVAHFVRMAGFGPGVVVVDPATV